MSARSSVTLHDKVAFLSRPGAWPEPTASVRKIETHMSLHLEDGEVRAPEKWKARGRWYLDIAQRELSGLGRSR